MKKDLFTRVQQIFEVTSSATTRLSPSITIEKECISAMVCVFIETYDSTP